MSLSTDPNSWGEFLATPPNMIGTPPGALPNELLTDIPPPFSPMIPETEMPDLFVPAQMIPPQQQHTPIIQKTASQPIQAQTYSEVGEIENRTLMISNANAATTENDIISIFGSKGEINKIDISRIQNGQFTVEYFDLRAATSAKMLLNGLNIRGNNIIINYAHLPIITDPKKPPNNGTIVIFHLHSGINDDQVKAIFGQFGEIRQIRGTPTKTQQRFVEYWDTRSAENALLSMSGKYVMGTRVSIEFSLPGGFRRGIQKVETSHQGGSPQIQKPNRNSLF